MTRRSGLLVALCTLLPLAAAAAPVLATAPGAERALAVRSTDATRDAILFRTEEGDGAALFLPTPDGGYALHIYGGLGPDVVRLAYVDANGDNAPDLVAVRKDGSVAVRLADRRGGFGLEPSTRTAIDHAAHHHAAPVATVTASTSRAKELALREDTLSTVLSSDRRPELGSLPAGFVPRLIASGHFTDSGSNALAVIGHGSRPRLVLLEPTAGGFEAREVRSPNTTFVVEVGNLGFSFDPPSLTIAPGDTVRWQFPDIGHNVVSGTSDCTPDDRFCFPNDMNCSLAPTSSTDDIYDHTFPTAGAFPYFCAPHCALGMTGEITVQVPSVAGSVPDGDAVPGVPLTIGKAPGGHLDLTWGASCTGTASDYAIYQGTIPIAGTYNHAAFVCTTGNLTSKNILPGTLRRYYLVVPQSPSDEGSYGKSRIGGVSAEIPPAAVACQPQTLTACP